MDAWRTQVFADKVANLPTIPVDLAPPSAWVLAWGLCATVSQLALPNGADVMFAGRVRC